MIDIDISGYRKAIEIFIVGYRIFYRHGAVRAPGGQHGRGEAFIRRDFFMMLQIMNGIVTSDRSPTPALAEVKKVYQEIKITAVDLAAGKVNIKNRYVFRDLSFVKGSWKIEENGAEIAAGALPKLDIAPGADREIALAKQDLARRYLYQNRQPEAMTLFAEFARHEDPELRAFGLAGQSVILARQGDFQKSAELLGTLWPDREKLDPAMRQLIDAALRFYSQASRRAVSRQTRSSECGA